MKTSATARSSNLQTRWRPRLCEVDTAPDGFALSVPQSLVGMRPVVRTTPSEPVRYDASQPVRYDTVPLRTDLRFFRFEHWCGTHVGIGLPMRYFTTDDQRRNYTLQVKDGLVMDAKGRPLNGRFDFVMNEHGHFYASKHYEWFTFVHHSTLVGGGPIAAAGEMAFENGRFTWISNASGHYHPSSKLCEQAIREMHRQGVDVSMVARRWLPGT